jgi:hypothetical protein
MSTFPVTPSPSPVGQQLVKGMVFDVIWMVVLAHHPAAFDRVGVLAGKYPVINYAMNLCRPVPNE